MEKSGNEQDRHLRTPQEANRDKHINFAAIENGDMDHSDETEGGDLTQSRFKEKVVEKKNTSNAKEVTGTDPDDEAH